MEKIVKRPFKVFDEESNDWEKHYFEVSADLVIQDAMHKFLTEEEIKKIFNPSKNMTGKSGYIVFPNGLILQWGNMTAGNPAKWIPFAMNFPNELFGVLMTGVQGHYQMTINGKNNGGFEALSDNSNDFYYLAFGY